MPKVKICGNTNVEDARLAVDLGADFVGIIFTESKRRASMEVAKAIVRALGDFKSIVAVFANQSKEEVETVAHELGGRILQFHGEETALYCHYFMDKGYEVIKTFRIKDGMSLKRIDEYNVSAFLFDAYKSEGKGGSGISFDWELIEDRPYVHEKLFLAGGLNVGNLHKAIQKVKPFAVDVASGVESAHGKKDPKLLAEFIRIAKEGEKACLRK